VTLNDTGMSSIIPSISNGCENDMVSATLRPSSWLIIGSLGMIMP
jgi:hypothetical protein